MTSLTPHERLPELPVVPCPWGLEPGKHGDRAAPSRLPVRWGRQSWDEIMRARCSPEPGSALGSVTLPSFSQFPSWGLGRGARPGQAGGRRMRCHIQARGRETGARDGTRANPGRHGSGRWAHLAFNQLALLGQFATSPSLEHKLCESLRSGCGDLREVPAGLPRNVTATAHRTVQRLQLFAASGASLNRPGCGVT